MPRLIGTGRRICALVALLGLVCSISVETIGHAGEMSSRPSALCQTVPGVAATGFATDKSGKPHDPATCVICIMARTMFTTLQPAYIPAESSIAICEAITASSRERSVTSTAFSPRVPPAA
jgi:hypothetical protein